MRYVNQFINQDYYNRLYEHPPSGLGYSVLPYQGSWNKYGPNLSLPSVFSARSYFAYNGLPENWNSVPQIFVGSAPYFHNRGPVNSVYKITINGVQSFSNPIEDGFCQNCEELNREWLVYYGQNGYAQSLGIPFNSLWANSYYYDRAFGPFGANTNIFGTTNEVGNPFFLMMDGSGLNLAAIPACGFAGCNIPDDFLRLNSFDNSGVYGVAGLTTGHNFVTQKNHKLIFFAKIGDVNITKIRDFFGTFHDNINVSNLTGPKMLENTFTLLPHISPSGCCDLSNASLTIEPIRDSLFDINNTFIGRSRYTHLPRLVGQNLTQNTIFLNNLYNVSFTSFASPIPCNDRIFHMNKWAGGLLNPQTVFPDAFDLEMIGITGVRSIIQQMDCSDFYNQHFNMVKGTAYSSGIAAIPIVLSGDYPSCIANRYFHSSLPNNFEDGTVFINNELTNFYNISDFGCADSIRELHEGTQGRFCNNAIFMDLLLYSSGTSKYKLESNIVFGEWSNTTWGSGVFLHNFKFRKTICDDYDPSNKCTEPFTMGLPGTSGSIASGLISCYNDSTWNNGSWTLDNFSPQRPNTNYFNSNSPAIPCDFSNADFILKPSKINTGETLNKCYMCNYYCKPQTINLTLVASGVTFGPYSYQNIGQSGGFPLLSLDKCVWSFNNKMITYSTELASVGFEPYGMLPEFSVEATQEGNWFFFPIVELEARRLTTLTCDSINISGAALYSDGFAPAVEFSLSGIIEFEDIICEDLSIYT